MFYVVNVITVGSRDGDVGSGCNSIGHYCTSLLFLLSMEEGCQEKGYHNHQTNRQVIKEVLLLVFTLLQKNFKLYICHLKFMEGSIYVHTCTISAFSPTVDAL